MNNPDEFKFAPSHIKFDILKLLPRKQRFLNIAISKVDIWNSEKLIWKSASIVNPYDAVKAIQLPDTTVIAIIHSTLVIQFTTPLCRLICYDIKAKLNVLFSQVNLSWTTWVGDTASLPVRANILYSYKILHFSRLAFLLLLIYTIQTWLISVALFIRAYGR